MGTGRTVWHAHFVMLLEERRPSGLELVPEVVLTSEPQKADLLLIRVAPNYAPSTARVLRGLWGQLSELTLLEYKSPSRPLRPGDWIRLLGYGAQYHAKHVTRLDGGAELTLVLIVPTLTPTVRAEAGRLKGTIERLEGAGLGYYRVTARPYRCLLVVLDEVAEEDRDPLLRWFSRATIEDVEVRRWLMAHSTEKHEGDLQALEGYEELLEKLLARATPAQRVAGLAPEERLAGLAPEERLAGLAPEEQLLALSDEVLRGLPEAYVRSLPEPVRAEIQRRLDEA
jgi:hypothetical protein